jgi:hypothetical protein
MSIVLGNEGHTDLLCLRPVALLMLRRISPIAHSATRVLE